MDKGYNSLYGNYRAKVINNKDKEKFGRVLVWIPDLMPFLDSRKDGIWARPANNPIGGRNTEAETKDNYYAGSSYIPLKGSWVWVFFESGNINRPYYFGALDIENTEVLPENTLGPDYEKKWTILKTHEGRAIVISDDSYDARTEITGKKRKIKSPPTGDSDSVYKIDENQTTILFDERTGKEKVLIRTYKGDFFHIDIDEQQLQCYFKNDIKIQTDADLSIKAKGNIRIEAEKSMYHESGEDMFRKSGRDIKEEATSEIHRKSGGRMLDFAGGSRHLRAGGAIATDGSIRQDQQGASSTASSSQKANPKAPEGKRDT